MYNPRWSTMAIVTAKEGNRSVQCPYAKNGTIGHQKTAKKFWKKINFFLSGVSEYPDLGCFAVLWTGGGKDMGEGLWKNDEVLLQEKRQSITFVREGCKRDLNGASGQTALWFDKSDFCPVFVPSFSGQAEQSAVRNWFTSGFLQPPVYSGRIQKDTKKTRRNLGPEREKGFCRIMRKNC